MFEHIQIVGDVVGDDNVIINGDVVIDKEILKNIAYDLVQKKIEILTDDARLVMKVAIDECINRIYNQIIENKLQDKLIDFSRPATQYALYSTLKGYAISDTIEQRELLIEAFIERIQVSWNSTDKMILDSVLEILPKLNPQCLSLLGLLYTRQCVIISSFSLMLNGYFVQLTPLVEQVAKIGNLDIAYLKQEKLLSLVGGLFPIAPLEEILLNQYDLFFRQPLANGIFDEYCKEFPEAHHGIVSNHGFCMMYKSNPDHGETLFCCSNSSYLKNMLLRDKQEYIIPHVDALMKMMPVFTKEEIRCYLNKISPEWNRIFDLFSSEDITKHTLSVVGAYLGGKILAKTTSNESLPLNQYFSKIYD